MDENNFFREATLRICGNLEIEVALWECLKYLKRVIPADNMILGVWEPDIKSIQIIAYATESGGINTNTFIHLPQSSMPTIDELEKRFRSSKWPDADIINDSSVDPLLHEATKHFNLKTCSVLHLILETVGRPLCSIGVFVKGKHMYTEQHGNILNLLKKPLAIAMSNALKLKEVVKLKELLADDNRYLHSELRQLSGYKIIGDNFGLKAVMEKTRQVAPLDSPVLLLGETGVGKDVIANAIHYTSNRKDGPFIKVNCGAIPESLIDSELFGHEKGSFTGALVEKRGRFERADKGTIFLDEIGELPLQAQVRLLRVLQDKEIERVGGTKTISLDIRIIAATNRDLEEMVKTKQFREDLLFRINVFPILIPPLRERKPDIPALLQHFINLKTKELKSPVIPKLSPGAIDLLMQYDWPGNVRELQNIVERAIILNPAGPLSFDQMTTQSARRESSRSPQIDPMTNNLDDMIYHHICQVLTMTNGKIHGPDGAAQLLGINANTLRHRMNKLGIDYKKKTR
ncbi:MAG: sigma 54-interacting transcriptional regulator [Chitinispirillia bacterium]|jgi:transcriptional regulator with GAF, ATPase, and Fis domain